jgi:hypothetical protein
MLLEKLDPATKQGRKDYVVGMGTGSGIAIVTRSSAKY